MTDTDYSSKIVEFEGDCLSTTETGWLLEVEEESFERLFFEFEQPVRLAEEQLQAPVIARTMLRD